MKVPMMEGLKEIKVGFRGVVREPLFSLYKPHYAAFLLQ